MKRRPRPRWRCWLCPAWGYGGTESERLTEFEAHYRQAHMERSRR